MFSLQKLLGKQDKFFDLLEASAEEARVSVQGLIALSKGPEPALMEQLIKPRRKDKQITEEISEALCRTFVTALEREDIEALSNALYKIPKTVEKFGERALLAPQQLQGVDFTSQTQLLAQAADVVLEMIKQLREGAHLEKMKSLNSRLQKLEGEADKNLIERFRDLYSGKYSPLQVIILKDLYELLEKVIDRCRDAGNVVFHIVLKNS